MECRIKPSYVDVGIIFLINSNGSLDIFQNNVVVRDSSRIPRPSLFTNDKKKRPSQLKGIKANCSLSYMCTSM